MSTDMTAPKRPRGRRLGWRKENPRDQVVKVKLTREEKTAILLGARECHETVSEYLRLAAKGRAVGLMLRLPTEDDQWPTEGRIKP